MNEHERLLIKKREEREQKALLRKQELEDYQKFLQVQKQNKLEKQKNYLCNLNVQNEEKEKILQDKFRMTKHEKKLNYGDLQAYKESDHSLYSMIPGWSPQIGSIRLSDKKGTNNE